jgi:hypothetical protein
MSATVVHDMAVPWVSSSAGLNVSVDLDGYVGTTPGSIRLTTAGAAGAEARFIPGAPVDLSPFDELRFWIRSDRAADGSVRRPFFLELTYTDANDAVGETHTWFVPVNRSGVWEQRRVGIENDRRSVIDGFRFRCLGPEAFTCNLDELLAVREEMLADLETALIDALEPMPSFPGLTDLTLQAPAAAGTASIVLPLNQRLAAGNRIRITGGSAGTETHDAVAVTHNVPGGTSTVDFGPADDLDGNLTVAAARVSVVAPILFEASPAPPPQLHPAIVITPLGLVEDLERTGYYQQRDSFRIRNGRMVCSVRPSARAYVADYQVSPIGVVHEEERLLREHVGTRLSMDVGLRINGSQAPVAILPPPELRRRELGQLAPLYVRVGTRAEIALRREQTWVQRVQVEANRIDAPPSEPPETIVLEV